MWRLTGAVPIALLVIGRLATAANGEPVKVADGTIVKLKLLKELRSGASQTGELVPYSVLTDVVGPNGEVLIAKGARGAGKVTRSKKRGMFGKAGKLEFTVDTVTAVDGTEIALRAVEKAGGKSNTATVVASALVLTVLAVFIHGRDVVVPEGTEFPAYVEGDATVDPTKRAPGATGGASGNAATGSPVMFDSADIEKMAASIIKAAEADPAVAERFKTGKTGVTKFRLVNIAPGAVADAIAENLVTCFIKAKVQVVEPSALDRLLGELKLTEGEMDAEKAKQVGKLAGVDLVLVGSILDQGNSFSINVRLIETVTGNAVIADRFDVMRKVDAATPGTRPTPAQ
jgi:TolB-like protein